MAGVAGLTASFVMFRDVNPLLIAVQLAPLSVERNTPRSTLGPYG